MKRVPHHFLPQNFKNYDENNKIKPFTNQLAKLFATTKTHKLNNIEDVETPTIDRPGKKFYMQL